MATNPQPESDAKPTTTKTSSEPATPLPSPILTLKHCLIRAYHPSDAPAIPRAANNPRVAEHLGPSFPSPYTAADADAWVRFAQAQTPTRHFAIFCFDPARGGGDGEGDARGGGAATFAGGIDLRPGQDVEARTAEVGYWLGEAHWGRGVMSEAVAAFSRWAFARDRDLRRLEIRAHAGNEGSCRVAAKAGYTLEGRRRLAGYKAPRGYFDIVVFGLLREECLGGGGGGDE